MSNIVSKRLVRQLLEKGLAPKIVAERAGCSVSYVYDIRKAAPTLCLPSPVDPVAASQPDVCPCCGNERTFVYETRKIQAGLLRRRKCSNCAARWNTAETIVKIVRNPGLDTHLIIKHVSSPHTAVLTPRGSPRG